MGLFNKNKTEKKAKKVNDKHDAMVKKLHDENTLQELRIKEEVIKEEEQRIKDMDFHHKLNVAKSKLSQLNDNFTVKLGMELNNLAKLQETGREEPIRKSMQRVKNYYYTLVVIDRAKERLYDVESDYEWSKTMGELSNTFKLMNKITSGYEPIKKLLFRIRLKKNEHLDDVEYSKLNGYYGKKIEDEVDGGTISALNDLDPIDMLVSDDLVNMIVKDSSDSNIYDKVRCGTGVSCDPGAMVNEVYSANKEAIASGNDPIDNDITPQPEYIPHTDEEISRSFSLL